MLELAVVGYLELPELLNETVLVFFVGFARKVIRYADDHPVVFSVFYPGEWSSYLIEVGGPLARTEGGTYNGMIVSVSDQFVSNADEEDQNGLIKEFRQLKITNDSKFQHIPDTTKEREILYITGPSGSGKSTYTRKYLEQYVKQFKGRPIYLFSSLQSDESLDKIKPKRIKLDDSLHTDPIKVQEFRESVCIFYNIDVISDKKIREAVYNILN
ncbi:MAG: AAA family ATPase, partial [Acidimicrobiaceae bacterium]